MQSNKLTIEEKLYHEVLKHIKNYRNLVLAFSGGLDSTALLHILYTINIRVKIEKTSLKLPFILRAIHIHHGLNNDANNWAQHCLYECNKRNIPCNVISINCNNNYGGLEAGARQMRYQYLFNNLDQKEILLTAQHLDDQSETFFLALKRGSGPTGLSSMPQKKITYNRQLLLRPLLQCTKKQIQIYAHNNKLTWINDNSNLNTRFDRNFLRLKILPILKNRWPKINENIARSAQLCSEQEMLLNELLQKELNILHQPDQSLLLKPLINMSIQKRQALLRRWLINFNVRMPSYKKLCHIWKNVILSRKDANPIIQLDEQLLLRRFQDKLYVLPKSIQISLNNTIIIWNDLKKTILLPNHLGTLTSKQFFNIQLLYSNIDYDFKKTIFSSNTLNKYISHKIFTFSIIRAPYKQETISIKFQYIQNDNIQIVGRRHKRKIKKIWQELKIPPWIRNKIPLLFYNNKLIAALGIFITQEGIIKHTDQGLGILWLQEKHANSTILSIPRYKEKNN